jgi:DNA ligase-associated metallophosphoesterase
MQSVALAGTSLGLLPSGAAFLPDGQMLLVADAHLGKAHSFRRLGVPVPEATTGDTLESLSADLALTGARQVVFLGDFLHAAAAQAPVVMQALADWRERHAAIGLTLVRGNHDARAGDPPASCRIEAIDEPLCVGPFALCHHPHPRPEGYVLAGHWHPCVPLRGRAHERLRLPCFWLGARVGILPAYGQFTGMHPIEPQSQDRVFAIAGDMVREVPGPATQFQVPVPTRKKARQP